MMCDSSDTDVERNSPVAALAAIETFAVFLVNLKRLAAGQQPVSDFSQLNAHSQSEAFFYAKQRIALWRMAEQMFHMYSVITYHVAEPSGFDFLPTRRQWAYFRAAQVAEVVHHATMTGDDPARMAEIAIMQGRETRTQGVR